MAVFAVSYATSATIVGSWLFFNRRWIQWGER